VATPAPAHAAEARECVSLCSFHYQVVIHRWGWTLVLNPDGTTAAWNPGRTKVLRSHGPPGPRRVNHPASPLAR